ncbi:hypothetical protein OQA88_9460 [Cercophora sp. LCS_1]
MSQESDLPPTFEEWLATLKISNKAFISVKAANKTLEKKMIATTEMLKQLFEVNNNMLHDYLLEQEQVIRLWTPQVYPTAFSMKTAAPKFKHPAQMMSVAMDIFEKNASEDICTTCSKPEHHEAERIKEEEEFREMEESLLPTWENVKGLPLTFINHWIARIQAELETRNAKLLTAVEEAGSRPKKKQRRV